MIILKKERQPRKINTYKEKDISFDDDDDE
jgi:hypothetical protein